MSLTVSNSSEIHLPTDGRLSTERIIDSNFIDENPEWKASRDLVDKDINNINAWNQLITLTELLLNKYPSPSATVKSVISSTFEELLSRFPLFFGYWKKFISITYQISGTDESIRVLSQSLDYFPTSLDLWIDYLTISISNNNNEKQKIRFLFEKAIPLIGYQFLSHPFWDKYLEFEKDDATATLQILLKLIKIPLHQYAKYYQAFLTLKESIDVNLIIKLEGIQLPEGNDPLNFTTEYFNNVFTSTQTFVGEIWTFESQIKQSFFNLAPIPEEDITTWDSYLKFLTVKYDLNPSDLNKSIIISTFERCLIPTALSPKFWYKYLEWYLNKFPENFESINEIYKRAVDLFIPTNFIDIRLNYALFLQIHDQESVKIHEVYLSIIQLNRLEPKPITHYLKYITRINGQNYSKTCEYFEIILARYFKRTSKGELDFHGKRFLELLNDKTIAIVIAELVKINWYYVGNKLNIKKLLTFYFKFDALKDNVIFWSLTYNYYKDHSDFAALSRVIKFIKHDSALPLSVINTILLDYSEFLSQNFAYEASISSNYDKILELDYNITHPFHYRIENDAQAYKNEVRQSGHPGVFIQKPEITNSVINKLASRTTITPMPTFKNVEKASLPIVYTKDDDE